MQTAGLPATLVHSSSYSMSHATRLLGIYVLASLTEMLSLLFTQGSSIEFDHAVYTNFHHTFYMLLCLCFISYKTQNIISFYGALQK